MRALGRKLIVAAALAAMLVVALGADNLKKLFAQGQAAETRQDYIAAYGFFKQAYAIKPGDLRYRVAYERTRFYAAAEYVQRGVKMRAAGDLDGAIQQFQTALTVDRSLRFGATGTRAHTGDEAEGHGAVAVPEEHAADRVLHEW